MIPTPPPTQYVRSGDSHIAYQVFGEGPDLLLSPGLNAIDVMWEHPACARFLEHLASFARVICYDKRGTGVSDPVPLASMLTLEGWLDEITAVLRAAATSRPALLGWEAGGMLAMLFAASHPDLTSALILVNSCPRITSASDYPWGRPLDAARHDARAAATTWGRGDTLDLHAPGLAEDRALRSWYGRLERFGISPTTRLRVREMLFVSDVRPALATISVPTLIVHRLDDPFVRVENGRFLRDNITGSRYVELPGDAHPPYLGDQDGIIEQVATFLTGAPPASNPDRSFATVLFTDIVGSTMKVIELGDRRWREVLDAHDRVTEREVTDHGGHLIKTTGDGILATFDGPVRAILCAHAVRSALLDLGVAIRAGVHAGEVERRGADIGGLAVHLCHRIQGKAAVGEILVSSDVPPLVAGSGITFTEAGRHQLKGFPGSWQLLSATSS